MSTIKVLHITTHDEECGIAKYQEQFLRSMKRIHSVHNDVFPYSPNVTKKMTPEEFGPVLAQFAQQLKGFDLLHIQHEFSFYDHSELAQFVGEAKKQGKKVIITVHTSLHAGIPRPKLKHIATHGPRHVMAVQKLRNKQINTHLKPIKAADLVLVHNSTTKDSLTSFGVKKSRIITIVMPVPKLDFSLKTNSITEYLGRGKGDVILCTVGFLSENKGMRDAVLAINELPEHYKLAMIGGAHPSGANDSFCGEMKDLVHELGLDNRVYITGYIKEDEILNAMIRECDVCIYPFHKPYYDGVSSASLNNSIANYKPTVAYPTKPILEMNARMPVVVTCKDSDHHELAETVLHLNLEKQKNASEKYAKVFAYDKEAEKLVAIYDDL